MNRSIQPVMPIDEKRLDILCKNEVCPACGSEMCLEFDSLDVDGPWVSQKVSCGECGATWVDNYRFQGIDRLENKRGAPIGEGEYWYPPYEVLMKIILKKKEVLPVLLGIDSSLDQMIHEALSGNSLEI